MPDWVTTILMAGATLSHGGGFVLFARRLRADEASPSLDRWCNVTLLVGLGLALAALGQRALAFDDWHPLQTHVDGLIAIVVILSCAAVYFQSRKRLGGLAGFSLPILALLDLWALCGTVWTVRPPWTIHSIWKGFHLLSVYGGTVFVVLAAGAGATFLFVDGQLRLRRSMRGLGRLASLESLETWMVHSAGLGFALLSIALLTGWVIMTQTPDYMSSTLWAEPKFWLAMGAWLVYALVMNVRHASHFRGVRAAWLSVAGLVLLLATFAALSVLDARQARAQTHDGPASSSLSPQTPESEVAP